MNIVIIGAGEVGFNLAKVLSREDYDITVIDNDPNKCNRAKTSLDAKVIEGDGASQRLLQKIDMNEVDYLLALTRIDEINLVCSHIAKKLGVKKVICRLRNTEYLHGRALVEPSDFNIDHVVFPEKAAQKEIENIIRNKTAIDIHELQEDALSLVGVLIEPSSPLIGRTVRQVEMSNPLTPHRLGVIYRGDNTFIPHNDSTYKKNDFAYFVCANTDIENIQKMCGRPSIDLKNIMILGAGKVGRLLAKSLQSDYHVRVVEKNESKAKKFSNKLTDTLMLVGDGLDIDFLESENINEVDCFIAATENEKTNILASLIVKHYGVKHVVLHISTTNYLHAVRRVGVDSVITKNISAINEVLNIIRSDEEQLKILRFEDIDVESVEVKVLENSRYLRKGYSLSDIPQNICLGAILRGDEFILPKNLSSIQSDDRLIILSKPDGISIIEDLFH